uniref:uncharacterized protein LOC130491702 n=1 Tax=Euleptes europaea TaxID=460621 RepID=UPI002541DB1E|nr:uncharacterized protein LOC130491702 [Euleptes europaea]
MAGPTLKRLCSSFPGLWRLAMIHFFLAHAAYHFSRWLPKHHRLRFQAAVFILGFSALLLQIYILLRPKSSRYCGQPLLYNLVGSIVFTFFTIGLALLLVMMEPLTGELKIIFSIFGMGSFAEGICTAILTSLAAQCVKTTPELYYTSVVLSVSSMFSTAFFSVLGLFWFANMASPGLVLNKQAKSGICYGPVSECSCLWHV